MGDIFVAANKTDELGGADKTVAEHGVKNVEVAVGDRPAWSLLWPSKF